MYYHNAPLRTDQALEMFCKKRFQLFTGRCFKIAFFISKHILLIKDQNIIKWVLNKGMLDLKGILGSFHRTIDRLNKKSKDQKSKIGKYKMAVSDHNEKVKLVIDNLKQKDDALNKEYELRKKTENEHENCAHQLAELNEHCGEQLATLRSQLDSATKKYTEIEELCNHKNDELLSYKSQLSKITVDCGDTQSQLTQANIKNTKLWVYFFYSVVQLRITKTQFM